MKRRSLVAILVACMLSAAIPLIAEDTSTQTDQTNKNECLLYSKKCMDNVDSLQDRMHKLDAEIKKGTTVYTPEELKNLEQKLKEANDTLDMLLKR
jgi:peptidoglycan hydrolase CwlO-like protein